MAGLLRDITELLKKDNRGNVLRGDVISLYNKDSLIWGGNRLVAALGVENLIIVDTPDALLICPKEKSQDIREIVATLKNKNRKEL